MTQTDTTVHAVDPSTQACSCGSDHDHGPTGADIVAGLGRGFGVLSLAVPALALGLLAACLFFTPSTPLVVLVGLGLGLAQLAILMAMSAISRRVRDSIASTPGFLGLRVLVEELARLAFVLLALVVFPFEVPGPLGLWVGVGSMVVWAVLTTTQLVTARNRILKPGNWSKGTVLSMLDQKISVKRAMTLRFLDIAAVFLFQLAATTLVALAPIMVAATLVLSAASGFSTLVLQQLPPRRRQSSFWAYVPVAIALGLSVIAFVFAIAPLAA